MCITPWAHLHLMGWGNSFQTLPAMSILMCPGAASKSGRGGRGQKGSLSSPLKTKSIMDGKITPDT